MSSPSAPFGQQREIPTDHVDLAPGAAAARMSASAAAVRSGSRPWCDTCQPAQPAPLLLLCRCRSLPGHHGDAGFILLSHTVMLAAAELN